MTYIYWAFIVLCIVGLGWSTRRDARKAAICHHDLDGFMLDAKQTSDKKTLLAVRSRLVIYIHKECFHKDLVRRGAEIVCFIDGKVSS